MDQRSLIAEEMQGRPQALEPRLKVTSAFPPVVASLIGVNVFVFFFLPVAFASYFPYHRESLGALWGPLVFSGEWWRVLTYSFVHFEFSHLFPNMLVLWILGKRMERELGKWIFSLFYIFCGMVAGLGGLALHPFTASIGASGAVAGLVGGVIAIYVPRVRSLPWRTRTKLGILILFAAGLVATEFTRGGLYLAHTTGLLAGLILCIFLMYVAKTRQSRYWTFALLTLLFVVAAALIQRYHGLGT